MVTFKEMLGHSSIADVPIVHQQNIAELLKRVNVLRAEWGKPMIVTSGYRTLQDHLKIYSLKGVTDKTKIPMASNHLSGKAVDLADANGELKEWIRAHTALLISAGLYCEDFGYTPTWVHFQSVPPKSGKRFFIP